MRKKIVTILNQIALILEIKGENAFKIRAYKNGSEIIENYGENIVQIAHDGKLNELKGIGKALASKIEEIVIHTRTFGTYNSTPKLSHVGT